MASKFGQWRIEQQLGEGGQGWTYLVRHDDGSSVGVLKRLKNKSRLDRFQREVDTLSGIDDGGIVKVLDSDLSAPSPYFVMEYCSGGTLDKVHPELTLREKLCMFSAVARAVGHLHDNDITHRDIKPSNILVRDDRRTPVIADFGLCYAEDGERHTLTGEAVGARRYMAPEFELGRQDEIIPASDVYSLGKLFYWLLSGQTLPRERHNDPPYDLRQKARPGFEANFMAGIYGVLNATIVEDPSKRLPEATILHTIVERLIIRYDHRFHTIGLHVPQHCNYCGIGSYQPISRVESGSFPGHSPPDSSNFGLGNKNGWLILVCQHCAHVQTFKLDYVEDAASRWLK